MPVMDGIEATTQIRRFLEERGEGTCIIGVTGHVQQEFQQKGIKAGMDEVYGKPLYNQTMKEILSKYYKA